ncbi:magnesium/cobalt transporter CorA [Methylotetracoccus oryzae]|uniref:magnesium/cobalt transporter CorA n=1 Tax=Methylotetracoccus oryzae TaxID=1919059 RepID=UPI00111A0772|nr:magnesium/cobalt transporter CorA [Methylotetracoccus oryzae]
MITALCLSGEKRTVDEVSIRAVSELRTNPANVIWVDVNDPTGRDFLDLAEEFQFHPMSIQDCRGGHQRPTIQEYPGYYLIVLYEAELAGPEDRLELRELSLFLGSNYLVTVHSKPLRAITATRRHWPTWIDRAELGAGLPAYLLFDAVVDDYMPLLDLLTERADELVDAVFGDFQPEVMREIFVIKRQLLYIRRGVLPLRDVFNLLLRREQPLFAREIHAYFQDIFHNLLRVGDMVDSLRDLLASAMDAYLSVSGARMNTIMKRLTSISTILMSASLIAGIYGMNFEQMPELEWQYGYVFALLSMIGVGLAIYLYLRRIKWL